jgi:CheY-like chemotaxis protein
MVSDITGQKRAGEFELSRQLPALHFHWKTPWRERGKEIDLVLMDLTMPHMDGTEAFGKLRESLAVLMPKRPTGEG